MVLTIEETTFFAQQAIFQQERAKPVTDLLSLEVEMRDVTAFCNICKTYSIRFDSRQIRKSDEAQTIIRICENGCKTK
jgi:DNA-directed RNA polymerase subunit M/transcription elongation factor TFIIS